LCVILILNLNNKQLPFGTPVANLFDETHNTILRKVPVMRSKEPMTDGNGMRTIVRGLVTPTDWDDNGNALDLSINSFDEQEYPVYMDTNGKKLISFVRQEVEVKGSFMGAGERRFKIHGYNLLKKK
jgi:hypothetical protein